MEKFEITVETQEPFKVQAQARRCAMEMESHKNACETHRLPIKKMKCQSIKVISNLVSMTDPHYFTQKQRPKTNNNRVRWVIANCKKTKVETKATNKFTKL